MADLPQTVILGTNISFMGLVALAHAIPYWACNRFLLKKTDPTMRYFIPFLLLQGGLMICSMAMTLTFSRNYGMMLILASVILLVNLLTDVLLLRTFDKIQKSAAAEAELQRAEMSLSAQIQYYSQLKGHMQSIRKLRHDMKNQLQTLGTLIREGELTQAEEQLQLVENAVDSTQIRRFTGNLIADAILDGKTKECEEKGIHLEVAGRIPVNLQVEGTVLCSILANLLDNAIHACEALPEEEERRIALKCDYNHPMLAINCVNTAGAKEVGKQTTPDLSAEHGWGLVIIKELAQRYSGGMDIRQEKGSVDVVVWLSAENAE